MPGDPAKGRHDVYAMTVYGFRNVAVSVAAGVTPLYRGEPGYRSGLDRDHDGIACE